MAASTLNQTQALNGARFATRPLRPAGRGAAPRTVALATRKVNTFDGDWKKGFWGTGYFNEDKEKAPVNVLRSVESKKLLSTAGKFKLLSSLDKAGLNLAKVEEMKLLSKAEQAGLLSLAERVLTSDPGTVTSLSIPFLLASVGSLVFIPTDSLPAFIAHWGAFAVAFGGFVTFFAGGFVLAGIQED
mmetsp:Transcript_14179/g.42793  ORF Transcript_14179/g.42793 Transcript_14179/m.42793 type:complete len:187 (+) Transcript_14179:215-775(+)